jgi:hypothetical protein
MPVHKEASKESSLEGGTGTVVDDSSSKDGGDNRPLGEVEDERINGLISPNDDEINPSMVEGVDDESQSPLHSRFIDDLLGDGDNDSIS